MRVYIPSQGRAGTFGNMRTTADSIKKATFVVPPNETERYARQLVGKGHYEILACPEQGIAKTRLWIGQLAAKRKESTFLMVDDDLSFFVRKAHDDYHLQLANGVDITYMLAWTELQFKDPKVAHVSVSVRQGNNTGPMGSELNAVVRNTRTLRYLAYRTETFLSMKHGRVPVMEDFDVNLQLLRAGFDNVASYWYVQDQHGTGAAGGCSSYRSLAVHNAAAEQLAELHKPFVKVRLKENKTGPIELRSRKEVTIYWKKARESAQ